ncbi:MAG: 2-oxoacid:acceptor oxidoreductase family protein [Chloroflexi bacterium]|nr:2-oxoacid:acceptor oxidoreductase family protein [Chloroflexota bacterium]
MSRIEIRIAGFGGQGIVTLGRLIIYAASLVGKYATETVAYGVEVRGGSSWADVVVDDEEVDYPRCSQADVAIFFSQEAATTFGKTVQDKGLVLYDPLGIEKLETRQGVRAFPVPATATARELGAAMVANTVMFGAFVMLSELLPVESGERGIQSAVRPEVLEVNLQAFRKGVELARQMKELQP